ncbi:MAG: ATP-binding cassette domain-containing protein [Actinomycetota bacterium]|nr:ATP-binding cassette domain-containing protein [Actinomycetota bacterium]
MGTLTYRGFGFQYPDAAHDALSEIDLVLEAGDLALVVGASGSGKSTLLRAANGIVPHSSGGRCTGMVEVSGRSTRSHVPRQLTDVVGFVQQDPEAQFVVDHVERDIVFSLENLGRPEHEMRRRVEEVLDALAIAHLRDRAPNTLSGGERQRVAIAGALASSPSVLVLDEPTSQLDPQGADDVFAALTRLNTELGTTVVVAEHRLDRVAPLADRAIMMADGRITDFGAPGGVLADYPGAPPVVRLGHLFGWNPRPLTVKHARALIAHTELPAAPPVVLPAPGAALVEARGLDVVLGGRPVLRAVDIDIRQGDVVALLGRNGAGKTTLLRVLAGLTDARRGSVTRSGRVAYVPQDPNALLYAPTVRHELRATLRLLGRPGGESAIDAMLAAHGLGEYGDRHPRTLSGGERQRLAVAAVAIGGAEVLALDEPTRGMDGPSRAALERMLRAHTAAGGGAVLATHDVELAARVATRVVVLGAGEVVAAGEAREVLSGSLFAPQMLRVAPPFLTYEEIEEAVAP